MNYRKMIFFKYFVQFFILIALVLIVGCSGTTPTTPVISFFSANPPSITAGESSTLSWSVTDATSVTIDHGIGTVESTDTTAVSPTSTTTYTLTATNTAGSVTSTATLTVNPIVIIYGSIDIKSTPTSATIVLDDIATGKFTPAVLTNVEPGNHKITLKRTFCKNWESTISIEAGETLNIDANLQEAPLFVECITDCIDVFVDKNLPDTNFENLSSLYVGDHGSNSFRSIIYFFELGDIPQDAVITNASVRFYYRDNLGATGTILIHAYEVIEGWYGSQINWNNMPAINSPNAGNILIGDSQLKSFIFIDVTDLYLSWIDHSKSNYGIMLKGSNEGTNNYAPIFFSSEYTDTSKTPGLIIRYYIP